ncbi:MAG: hypothetical protein M0Z41_12970, partial [Peptococcaceae bacterium]|nr:hypothetical protein [Peptococcaceae bacterium]
MVGFPQAANIAPFLGLWFQIGDLQGVKYGNDSVVPENIFPARQDSIGFMSKYWHHVAPNTRGAPAMRLQKKRVRGYTYWYLVESK